ncbi:putative low affinity vacuolar monovalent cation/H(+) antiporter [Apostichopus japonicus]|uniref:Putative low affinity vacuolar monovalent cation/H(+) antiporter n=1 Tax=Stichopus japonicus TaxID=307972 RepID=A0A2G8JPV3_STIJA|nr:putative low affinity vacuolar monovalent cation/H(+) antiporter [Apostichopus japonicus]
MGIGLAVFIMHYINESLPSVVHMLSETTMAFIKDRSKRRGKTSHSNMESSSEIDLGNTSCESDRFPNVRQHQTLLRHRSTTLKDNMEDGFVLLESPENEIEEKKMEQNYMFGFKKWKAHVTQRPFEERSEAVKSLYVTRLSALQSLRSTLLPGNIAYSILIGWWIFLVYLCVALVMAVTVIGWPYAKFCWKLAWYFLWPFGKYVTEASSYELEQAIVQVGNEEGDEHRVTSDADHIIENEGASLLCENKEADLADAETGHLCLAVVGRSDNILCSCCHHNPDWVGDFFYSNIKVVRIVFEEVVLFTAREDAIRKSFHSFKKDKPLEVLLCCYQAVNRNFYKFTVDGMSILVTSILLKLEMYTIILYHHKVVTSSVPFSTPSLVPSLKSSSTFPCFLKQKNVTDKDPCYSEVVKSALTGSLLATMLFIPGLCMVVGGIKHKEQAVNVRSASVSSTLLFISVAGVFTPTIFAFTYGGYSCWDCYIDNMNDTYVSSYECERCRYSVTIQGNSDFYTERVQPIVISIAALLPLAYVIGLVYSLFTHASVLEEHFKEKEKEGGGARISQSGQHSSSQHSGHHSKPEVLWGRAKSVIILIIFTVAMALCAEVAVGSLQEILESESTKITEAFIGVTVIAVVPEIPEIINGVQFALKNNINLSLEIGSSIAVQVCLLQIPTLVALDYVFSLNFRLLFNDLHLWSVILSVIIMNYTFVDGKSDYFQGSMLCIVYFILLVMFFYAPESRVCRN